MATTWKDEMIQNVVELCKVGVERWGALIDILGVPEQIRKEWCSTYLSEMNNVMSDMYTDLEERQKNMQKVIADLKTRAHEIAYELGTSALFQPSPSLYCEEASIKLYLADLEGQLTRKQGEIKQLKERQDAICATLGKPPKVFSEKPLPSAEDIEDLLLYIESLEDECFLREEKYAAIQSELQILASEIEYEPVSDFEKQVLHNCSKTPFEVSDKNMIHLNAFKQSLEMHTENIKTEVGIFVDQIRQLWDTLETDEKYCTAFLHAHTGYKKQVIINLKKEIKRLEDLKRANIGMLIRRLKSQLVVQWDLCHYSDDQRKTFDCFDDDMYTESMLTLFQNELKKVSKHYEDNKLLFDLILKYQETLKRVEELETPEQGQDRFKNRGGKLLLEEKERKIARKRLEKLEQSILKMMDDYFKLTNEEFLYEGVPADSYLQSLRDIKDDKILHATALTRSGLNSVKSTGGFDGDRTKSGTKTAVRPLHPSNSRTSPKRRSTTLQGNDRTGMKPQTSSLSELTKSAPVKGNNPIRKRKEMRKKPKANDKFYHKSKMMLDVINQDEGGDLCVMHNYSHFQKIVDTSMPSLINITMDGLNASENKRSTHQFDMDLESPLAVPLAKSPNISENANIIDDSMLTTPKSGFSNITMRRHHRSRDDSYN